jgi:hypothetical protein
MFPSNHFFTEVALKLGLSASSDSLDGLLDWPEWNAGCKLKPGSEQSARLVAPTKSWPPRFPSLSDQRIERQVFAPNPRIIRASVESFSMSVLFYRNHTRLRFIGQWVLRFVASNLIMDKFPRAGSHELTERLDYIICDKTLAMWASMYEFERYMETEQDNEDLQIQEMGFSDATENSLAHAMEAYIGAVYVDGSHGHVIVKKWLGLLIKAALRDEGEEDGEDGYDDDYDAYEDDYDDYDDCRRYDHDEFDDNYEQYPDLAEAAAKMNKMAIR